jgi:hypothetical protein
MIPYITVGTATVASTKVRRVCPAGPPGSRAAPKLTWSASPLSLRGVDGDGDFSACFAGVEVAHGFRDLLQPVGPVDDRLEGACLDESAEVLEARCALTAHDHGQPLADERGQGQGSLPSRAAANSANGPLPKPKTSSPIENLVTAAPTAATLPARSSPGTGFLGARIP